MADPGDARQQAAGQTNGQLRATILAALSEWGNESHAKRQAAADAVGLLLVRVQEAERALREIARREHIAETTDGTPIDSAVHGREEANATARAYFGVGGDVQEQEMTTDSGDGAAVSSGGDS